MKGKQTYSGDWERVAEKAKEVSQDLDKDQEEFEEWRPEQSDCYEDTQKTTVEQESGDGVIGKIERLVYRITVKTNPCYFEGAEITAVLERHIYGGYTLTVHQ